ncbi:DUF1801 domain-containing protein [Thalassotalea sp. ND16A]|uniref:DUF1801 domain-containing protein n=1 Tax=Thalassotalea sp. ND16A TaxID=1535422 RepID=UPI000519FBD5|nr:DUF1801 domain-containing protein [Thalassotalea sp. ND16A]KGJ95662.1 hypothetical protein ND16A_1197 [Thalassotalea sp. ND16A]
MNENKTQPSKLDVQTFINNVESQQKRVDTELLLQIFSDTTNKKPVMWGTSIIGFGQYHYQYESGREGDAAITGFSPRKQNIAIYITQGFSQFTELLAQLGKHKTGKSCLYINKLADIDENILKKIISLSFEHMLTTYDCK